MDGIITNSLFLLFSFGTNDNNINNVVIPISMLHDKLLSTTIVIAVNSINIGSIHKHAFLKFLLIKYVIPNSITYNSDII